MAFDGADLRCLLLLARVRARFSVVRVRREAATLFGVGCSDAEVARLREIADRSLIQLRATLMFAVGETARPRRPRVICIGEKAQMPHLPREVTNYCGIDRFRGTWIREIRSAFACFGERTPVVRIIVHELTHAYLDVLSHGFPYPIGLQEGFARAMEYYFAGWRAETEGRSSENAEGAVAVNRLNPSQYVDVETLMSDGRALARKHCDPTSGVFANAAFWFYGFLAQFQDRYTELRQLPYYLRRRNLRAATEIVEWLAATLKMTRGDLEGAFHAYCTEGILPQPG